MSKASVSQFLSNGARPEQIEKRSRRSRSPPSPPHATVAVAANNNEKKKMVLNEIRNDTRRAWWFQRTKQREQQNRVRNKKKKRKEKYDKRMNVVQKYPTAKYPSANSPANNIFLFRISHCDHHLTLSRTHSGRERSAICGVWCVYVHLPLIRLYANHSPTESFALFVHHPHHCSISPSFAFSLSSYSSSRPSQIN